MAVYISLTAIGKDKLGIVSTVSKVLADKNCNIEDSTMTILFGHFAMILIITLPKKLSVSTLFSQLKKNTAPLGILLSYSPINYVLKKKIIADNFIISVYGSDKTGIVYNVCQYLANKKINITDVQTSLLKNKNTKVYIMIIETEIPKKLGIEIISKELNVLAKNLDVSISLNKAETSKI
ncbi:MAG: transcriptional regulator [Elusimicrobiota bacterium]|jgi:glycine cleavage system transcriptional repressor|nr:transcriptional regulator [Elusimicrobiota bacterium]